MASIDLLCRDLEVEAEWNLANMMGGLDVGSRASIDGTYRRISEACSTVIESVSSPAADLLSSAIHSVEAMRRTSIREVRVDALESTVI